MNAFATSMPTADGVTIHVAAFDSSLGVPHVACLPAGACALVFDDRREALEPRLRRVWALVAALSRWA